MPRARSVAIALAAAALATPAGAFAQGSSGAGDAQYGDPFSEEQTRPSDDPATSGSQTGGGDLSQEPDLGGGGSGGSAGGSGSTTAPSTGGTGAGALPNTGSDPRLIILAGLALLLSGLGLRLRTADETF